MNSLSRFLIKGCIQSLRLWLNGIDDRLGILTSALILVSQLLRLDRVLPVKRGVMINKQENEHSDSDSESQDMTQVEQS